MQNKRDSLRHLLMLRRALTVMCSVACIALLLLSVYSSHVAVRLVSVLMLAGVLFTAWSIVRHAGSLHSHVSRQSEAAAEAEEHYFGVLCEVMSVVEARDRFLAGRSRRMSFLVSQIAAGMDMAPEAVALLGKVARVHDIGLLSVPAEVISKAGGLSNLEFSIVKRHCQVGCHILQPLRTLKGAMKAVLYHHERMNGTGYPEGLKGEDIPIEARIMAVADSFDAMTHDRPHRAALMPAVAMSELVRCADAGYDRKVIIALAKSLRMTDQLPPEWGIDAETAVDADADAAQKETQAVS